MSICQKCGSKRDPFDQNGNPYDTCPKGCELEDRDPMSPEECDQVVENLGNVDPDFELTKTSNCWTTVSYGSPCPGVVLRTPQTADPPYGHFCPECGHSLRDNPIYGVGGPRDRGVTSY